ncbi:resolvase [Campylobacter sp. MIT 12-8780]|uniref:recombinase family protein n=1 Tax=unclassified Campylobacter TaxID=2593542 RepID=UPI0010F7143A|nr:MULTISPECIES: recombinase family protein [unclassified Campylobacter]NDJ28185.1 recombinase family protein [Campylobacter sp. MIT 19-121]TKX28264.1 resolvase [Campylobacter sp. MIT 12-5580]TQR39988.1 resolvase [Campylobacter sp. MIT 12-8780]
MVVAYVRVSTNKQDTDVQKMQILEYAQKEKLIIDRFIEVQQSAGKSFKKRKIDELKKLKKGDVLIVYELSRLGRSMFETMNFILDLSNKGIQFVFLKQLELSSFNNPHSKLLLSFYAYIAEVEKDFISQRTKAGLEKAKASGKILGRPFGVLSSMHDESKNIIQELLNKGMSMKSIWIYLGKKGTYSNFYLFCKSRKLHKRIENTTLI